jgi:hypothetical protein
MIAVAASSKVSAAELRIHRTPLGECEQSKSPGQQLAMMIGHCIFIIKHFCAAVNFDYRLAGKLKIYFQPPLQRQCQLLPPTQLYSTCRDEKFRKAVSYPKIYQIIDILASVVVKSALF